MVFDLNYYLNKSLEVKIGEEVVHVRQPSISVQKKIDVVEKDLTEENILDKRVEVLKIMLDNNVEGKVFKAKDLELYPAQVVTDLINKFSELYDEALTDPN